MPSYDYVCRECDESFEIRATISEYSAGLKPRCPGCGSRKTERSFSSVTVLTSSRGSTGPKKACSLGCCPPNCSC
ncbi:MAG: zinc ribbon domain-containing protein [Gemmatimonadota bacterium]|nr:MAG: zinc ribbon domain-containing protein [Gemmatimonadota bacterium]